MNRLPGRIVAIETHGSIAVVEAAVGVHTITATLIGAGEEIKTWRRDMQIGLLFKATEVALAKKLSGLISMRNRMPAVVTAIEHGKLLTKVMLDFDGHPISSVITTRSAHALGLDVGDKLEALVKANEMTVVTESGT